MNIFLISLIDRRIEGAMIKFSKLPIPSSVFLSNQHIKLGKLAKGVLETYIRFFECVEIVPPQYRYLQDRIARKISLTTSESKPGKRNYNGPIEAKLHQLSQLPIIDPMIPVHLHIRQQDMILLYTGIGVVQGTGNAIDFSLHELSIPAHSIRHTSQSRSYLVDILDRDKKNSVKSLRELVADMGKNYNQFQSDCKDYFGDTFHQFNNKMKMLDVVEDILFTNYSLKEISHRNDFSNYNSMYSLFSRRYNFPLDSIPRILSEI
jgi:AraC-like DNA-binding protein